MYEGLIPPYFLVCLFPHVYDFIHRKYVQLKYLVYICYGCIALEENWNLTPIWLNIAGMRSVKNSDNSGMGYWWEDADASLFMIYGWMGVLGLEIFEWELIAGWNYLGEGTIGRYN